MFDVTTDMSPIMKHRFLDVSPPNRAGPRILPLQIAARRGFFQLWISQQRMSVVLELEPRKRIEVASK